ncbi:MAG: AAA family ATPase [Proteobacteria bacterium]|nr:AAA family ATPase [Pseudomonadota bacterium]
MGLTFALAGKGGTGKTTLAGLLVRYLVEHDLRPVLAVDADANANLNEVLGQEVEVTLGEAREEMKSTQSVSMTKDQLIEMRVNQALIEAEGYDLIVMGRPEGAGCYCAANSVLSSVLDKLSINYPYMVMDNEAGLEHISRLITKSIDHMLIVTDPTRRGILTAGRIKELTQNLPMAVGAIHLILNQVRGEDFSALAKMSAEHGLEVLGSIPADDQLAQFDLEGKPTTQLPGDNPAVKAAFGLFDKLVAAHLGQGMTGAA